MKHPDSDALLHIFQAALLAVNGQHAVAERLRRLPLKGEVCMVAVGKAAQSMAQGAHEVLNGQITRGLAIDEMNRVRKGLSRIKRGGLLQWLGERPVHALAISDVPGDDPVVIGSGLLVPDSTLANGLLQLDLPTMIGLKL